MLKIVFYNNENIKSAAIIDTLDIKTSGKIEYYFDVYAFKKVGDTYVWSKTILTTDFESQNPEMFTNKNIFDIEIMIEAISKLFEAKL